MDESDDAPLPDFARVDASGQAQAMVKGMDTAAMWPAVRQLRAWEADRLQLASGETLLDVGCGPGDAGIALCAASGARMSGIDASETMLAVARDRAAASGIVADFQLGDAQALAYPDDSCDALRSERTLQWVSDPRRALADFCRVLRPGGRLVVTDTDWDSFTVDLPDRSDFAALNAAMRQRRGAGFAIGRQLLNHCRELGLRDLACTAATHVVTAYDPAAPLEANGIPPLQDLARGLASAGLLAADAADRFSAQVDEAGRNDRIFMALTMYAVYGVKP